MSGQWANSTRRARLPKSWHAQRQRILRIHKRICHVCGGPGSDSVDHVVQGDDHSDDNLRPIHQDVPPYCHRGKSAREGAGASAEQRRRIVALRKRKEETHPGLL